MLQLQGNKLVIEKLTIYDRIGIVKVVLVSGFVGEASEALLSPIPSGHLKPGDRCVLQAKELFGSLRIKSYIC